MEVVTAYEVGKFMRKHETSALTHVFVLLGFRSGRVVGVPIIGREKAEQAFKSGGEEYNMSSFALLNHRGREIEYDMALISDGSTIHAHKKEEKIQ